MTSDTTIGERVEIVDGGLGAKCIGRGTVQSKPTYDIDGTLATFVVVKIDDDVDATMLHRSGIDVEDDRTVTLTPAEVR